MRAIHWLNVEFKAVDGITGVEFALISNFDKELLSSNYGWVTDKADVVTIEQDDKKHKRTLEANAKVIHLLVVSVKGVTWRNIVNKKYKPAPSF